MASLQTKVSPSEQVLERIVVSEPVLISVIIPNYYSSRKENVGRLVTMLRDQTRKDAEILIVHGVSPQGNAINTGARAAIGKYLVVLDDDSQMDRTDILENLVRVIDTHPDVGMAGASIISPANINTFQRAAAKQFPRFHMPVVESVTDSDMPCHGCVIFPRAVFDQVGMERDDILRGLDPDLRVRIRRAGYRVVLVPQTWVYHPFPATVGKFARLFFRNGYGSAYLQTFYPEINYDTDEAVNSENFVAKRSLAFRLVRFPLRLLKSILMFQWIRFLGYAVYVFGYAYGVVKFQWMRLLGQNPRV